MAFLWPSSETFARYLLLVGAGEPVEKGTPKSGACFRTDSGQLHTLRIPKTAALGVGAGKWTKAMKKLLVFLFVALGVLPFCACGDDDQAVVYDETEARTYLKQLFTDANGVKWQNNTLWNSAAPINDWYGVDFKSGCLTVDLKENRLNGTASFEGCNFLSSVDLSKNQLREIALNDCAVLMKIDCEGCVGLKELRVDVRC